MAEESIRGAAQRIREADEEWLEATKDLKRYSREARRQGVPVVQIAQSAKVSRQTVYDWTRDG